MQLLITYPDQEMMLDVAWFEIETPVGSFIIHEGHAPTILSLTPNRPLIVRLANGKEESIPLASGIVHITRTGASILAGE